MYSIPYFQLHVRYFFNVWNFDYTRYTYINAFFGIKYVVCLESMGLSLSLKLWERIFCRKNCYYRAGQTWKVRDKINLTLFAQQCTVHMHDHLDNLTFPPMKTKPGSKLLVLVHTFELHFYGHRMQLFIRLSKRFNIGHDRQFFFISYSCNFASFLLFCAELR